jgi:hypothetical protein
LLHTLVFSLPALRNVGSVLLLFFFIFAVMGMNLFGRIKMQDNVTRHANFNDFPSAMLLLFRMATGESWNGIMHDCTIERACVELITGDLAGTFLDTDAAALSGLVEEVDFVDRCTPSRVGTVAFFCIFELLCAFVMLNLVIAVILDNFEEYNKQEALPVSESDFGQFAYEWGKLDRFSSYYIQITEFPTLLKRLNAPLGLKAIPFDLQRRALSKFLLGCDVRNKGGRIHFVDTLQALALRVEGVERPTPGSGGDDASVHAPADAATDAAADAAEPDRGDGGLSVMRSFGYRNGDQDGDGEGKGDREDGLETGRGRTSARTSATQDVEVTDVSHYFAALLVQSSWKGKMVRRGLERKRSLVGGGGEKGEGEGGAVRLSLEGKGGGAGAGAPLEDGDR